MQMVPINIYFMNTILSLQNILKQYPATTGFAGIANISLELTKGEVVCLVGPSGAGKSTLLRCVAGLESMDSGQVLLEGAMPKDGDITFVFQDYNLWSHKTVLENIVLAPVLSGKVSRSEAVAHASFLLERFSLLDKKDAYPDFLSGGQKQRAAIIRALAIKPKVLLLDEITSALDPELVNSVLNVIKVLAKEGQSMLIATHQLKFATEVADRIIFLESGKQAQVSSPQDFLYGQTNPRIVEFIKTLNLHTQEISVYEGYDQFQAFQLGLLKRQRAGEAQCVVGSSGDRWFECMGKYYKDYEKLRIEKSIPWRMLMYSESARDKDIRLRHPLLNEYRLMPATLENPANYYVVGDVVVIQIFGEPGDEPAVIEIKNAHLAKSYQNYFNLLWEQSTAII